MIYAHDYADICFKLVRFESVRARFCFEFNSRFTIYIEAMVLSLSFVVYTREYAYICFEIYIMHLK
jgi:hypothetical protein